MNNINCGQLVAGHQLDNQAATGIGDRARQHNYSAAALTSKAFNEIRNLVRVASAGGDDFHRERRRRRLNGAPHSNLGYLYRIVNDSDLANLRCDLSKHLKHFGSGRELVRGKPG